MPWIGAWLLASPAALADAVLLEGEAGSVVPTSSVEISTVVRAQVAETTVTTRFAPLSEPTAMYAFGLPADATAYRLEVEVGGETSAATVEAGDAAAWPSAIPTERGEALGEYLGPNPLRSWLGPFEPGTQVTVRLSYVELLPFAEGAVTASWPLAPFALDDASAPVSVALAVDAEGPLVSWQAAGWTVSAGEAHLEATIAGAPRADAAVSWVVDRGDVGLTLFAHRPAENPWGDGPDGYFLLLVDPPLSAEPVAKRFTHVIDQSGSMSGDKMVSARRAGLSAIDALHDGDQFDVVAFDDKVTLLANRPLGTSDRERERGREFVDGLDARGGTDIHAAVMVALGEEVDAPVRRTGCGGGIGPARIRTDSELPHVVLLLTDGMPSSGVSDPAQIVEEVGAANADGAAIWSVAIGQGAGIDFLTRLSESNRGRAVAVPESGDLAEQLDAVFRALNDPVLVLPELTIDGGDPRDVLPEQLPDLFLGARIVVVGRYAAPGPVSVQLDGTLAATDASYGFDAELPALAEGDPFVARIWAATLVRHLLGRIAVEGEEPELVERVTELGIAYGLETPYTPFTFGGTTFGGDAMANGKGCSCDAASAGRAPWLALVLLVASRRRRRT